jgi:O-methyltransferase
MAVVKFAQKVLAGRGFELKFQAQPAYVDKAAIQQATALIEGYTMLSRTRLVSLADQVSYCNARGLEGAFVECGVWKGGAVALMAYISKLTGREDRSLHLFDAFQDICAPNPDVDGAKALNETAKFGTYKEGEVQPLTGVYDRFGGHGTIDACREVIAKTGYPDRYVHFHEGWFQDTVFEAAKTIGPISLLRLDGDWYESTKICLEAFYDQVTPGGFVIFDDYMTYEGCKKAVDEFLETRDVKPFLIRCDTSCYYIVKE